GHADGHLLGDRRRRALDPAAGGDLQPESGAPRDHFRREPGARVPASAAGAQPAARVGAVQEAGARGDLGDAANAGDPRDRRAAHHLLAVADAGDPALDGPRVIVMAIWPTIGISSTE